MGMGKKSKVSVAVRLACGAGPPYRQGSSQKVWRPLLRPFRRDVDHLAAVLARTARSTPLFGELLEHLFLQARGFDSHRLH